MMLRHAGLLFVAMLLAACSVAPPPSSPSPTGSSAPASPVPIETPTPLDPDVIGLTCGQEPVFHPALLEVPGRAEAEGDAPAALLRDYLSRQGEAGLPSTGWTRVAQTADYVQFVARAPFDSGWGVVAFMVRGGRWEFALAGECHLGPAVPEGVSIAEWRLDPAFPAPAPGDRIIHTLINERACASGQSPEGRVLPAVVTYEPERVVALIVVRTIGGDCPGNPDFAFPIELSEPLGERPLFDGGKFPPFGPIGHYSLDCGPMETQACIAFAQRAVANAEGQRPGHRVIAVMIFGADGDNQLVFDDGTIVGADIN